MQQSFEVFCFGHLTLLYNKIAFTNLLQYVDMKTLAWVNTHENQPVFAAQLIEEIEHEANVTILGIELRFVKYSP